MFCGPHCAFSEKMSNYWHLLYYYVIRCLISIWLLLFVRGLEILLMPKSFKLFWLFSKYWIPGSDVFMSTLGNWPLDSLMQSQVISFTFYIESDFRNRHISCRQARITPLCTNFNWYTFVGIIKIHIYFFCCGQQNSENQEKMLLI